MIAKIAISLIVSAVLATGCVSIQEEKKDVLSSIDQYKVVLNVPPAKVPSTKTSDGALAGNGDLGITLGGTPDSLTLYVGKNDFWLAYPVYPGGIASPGGLDLQVPALKEADYQVEQLPGSAEIRGRFTRGDTCLKMSAWVAALHNWIVVELESNRQLDVSLRLWATEGLSSTNSNGNEPVAWVTRSFADLPSLRWPSHIAMALGVPGQPQSGSSVLSLQPGVKQWMVVTAYTNHDTGQWKERTIAEAGQITADMLRQAKKEHQDWWRSFWEESSVSIHDEELEQLYYMSQYLFACSSRSGKFAPGIWGPFVTCDNAAWGGDYHLNYNYQAPYWAAYSSNHIHLTDNFDQPLLDYMESGRKHAKELLNCRGIYYPVGIGPKGLCTSMWPFTPEEMMEKYATTENTIDGGYKFLGQKINAVFSVGNMLMRHYSTYDEEYARRVYPYLLACADFWEDYLCLEDGRYVIKMDHFNEVMPNKRNHGQWRHRLGDFNSTLSLGLVRMLFQGVMDMSEFLQADADRRPKWEDILARLSDYPVVRNADGRLTLRNMEKAPKGVENTPAGLNRVSIHGLILPGGVAGPVTDSVFNAILLDDVSHWKDKMRRADDWGNTYNNGIETCYPGAVRVGYPAQEILEHLKKRIALTLYPNGWIVQGGGGIETLAAVPLTINEMLLQSYEGTVRVFPNWDRNRDASFNQLRAYGAFLVSGSLKGGRIEAVSLTSEKGRPCRMENPWPGKEVELWRNGTKAETLSGKYLTFPTSAGEQIELKGKP